MIIKSETMNSMIIILTNSLSEPVTGIVNMILVDGDTYITVTDVMRPLLSLNHPVFTKDSNGDYKHLTDYTSPTRTDAIADLDTVIYSGIILSSGNTEIRNGHYNITYNLPSAASKVRLFVEDTSDNALYEKEEFKDYVLIDYDEMDYMYQVVKGFAVDDVNNKLFFNFDNGHGDFEIPLTKIPSIPNNILNDTMKVESYMSNVLNYYSSTEKLDAATSASALTAEKVVGLDLYNKATAVHELMKNASTTSGNDWDYAATTYTGSLESDVTFTVTELNKTVIGDSINVLVDDVIRFDDQMFKVLAVDRYDKISANADSYAEYNDPANSKYLEDVYIYNHIEDTYRLLSNPTERENVISYAISHTVGYYDRLYINDPIGSFVLDRYPLRDYSGTIKKLASQQSEAYSKVLVLEKLNHIPNIYTILDSVNMAVTLNNAKNFEKSADQRLSHIEYAQNENNKWAMQQFLSVDEINSKLRLVVDWEEPALVDEEQIVSYQVAHFVVNKSAEKDLDKFTSTIDYGMYLNDSSTDLVIDMKNYLASAIHEEKIYNYDIKQKTLDVKKSEIITGALGSSTVTFKDAIFTTDDSVSNNKGNERYITVSGTKYLINSYISPNSVSLMAPLQVTATGLAAELRHKYPVYKNINNIADSKLIISDVSLNDVIVFSVRAITELDVVGPWSSPRKIIPINTTYKGSSKYFLTYLEEDLSIVTNYTQFNSIEPKPPILESKNFTFYDVNNVNMDSNKVMNDKLSTIRRNNIAIDNIKAEIAAKRTNSLVDLNNDYRLNTALPDPTFVPDLKNVYMDIVRVSDSDRRRIHELTNGTENGEYTAGGVKKKALLLLYTENIQLKIDVKDMEVPDRFKKYKIAFTFSEPSRNNSTQITQYVLKHKVKVDDAKIGHAGKRSSLKDPDDENNNIDLGEKVTYSPTLQVVTIDPFTNNKTYVKSSNIRKFEVDALLNVEYEFRVAAISDNKLQSEWSEAFSYKIQLDTSIDAASSTFDTREIIADQLASSMLEYNNELEKAKLDISNVIFSVNEQMKSLFDKSALVDASIVSVNNILATKVDVGA